MSGWYRSELWVGKSQTALCKFSWQFKFPGLTDFRAVLVEQIKGCRNCSSNPKSAALAQHQGLAHVLEQLCIEVRVEDANGAVVLDVIGPIAQQVFRVR